MEPVNPLKSFSLANAATPAILSGSLADDPPAVRQDLKATKTFAFLREALRYGAHPCMARGTEHRSMNFAGMQSTCAHC